MGYACWLPDGDAYFVTAEAKTVGIEEAFKKKSLCVIVRRKGEIADNVPEWIANSVKVEKQIRTKTKMRKQSEPNDPMKKALLEKLVVIQPIDGVKSGKILPNGEGAYINGKKQFHAEF